ncbi:MAG: hypothetical protein AB7E47_11455 [Desulfovibrionaceae bacterium]
MEKLFNCISSVAARSGDRHGVVAASKKTLRALPHIHKFSTEKSKQETVD